MTNVSVEDYEKLRKKYKLDEGSIDDTEELLKEVTFDFKEQALIFVVCPFKDELGSSFCNMELAEKDPDEEEIDGMKLAISSHMHTSHYKMG